MAYEFIWGPIVKERLKKELKEETYFKINNKIDRILNITIISFIVMLLGCILVESFIGFNQIGFVILLFSLFVLGFLLILNRKRKLKKMIIRLKYLRGEIVRLKPLICDGECCIEDYKTLKSAEEAIGEKNRITEYLNDSRFVDKIKIPNN